MKNIIGLNNPYGVIQKAGKVQTRNKSRKLRTRKQMYRSRVKQSQCRGKKTKSGTRKS